MLKNKAKNGLIQPDCAAPCVENEVCADIVNSQRRSAAKYDTAAASNSEQWLQHAYEECLEQAVYLKKAIAATETQSLTDSKDVSNSGVYRLRGKGWSKNLNWAESSTVLEIIATLWTILWAILWANAASTPLLWAIGIKATLDHLNAVRFAIREIRRENALRV